MSTLITQKKSKKNKQKKNKRGSNDYLSSKNDIQVAICLLA